jgi:hypothetical protein
MQHVNPEIQVAAKASLLSQFSQIALLLANPMFTNPQAGDYSLELSSPAFNLGFSAIDVPLAP